jgi:hypothetical protein
MRMIEQRKADVGPDESFRSPPDALFDALKGDGAQWPRSCKHC